MEIISELVDLIVEKREFYSDNITKEDDGWNIYPLGDCKNPVFISKRNYNGKMPPRFKFFWQSHKLEIEKVFNFIKTATLDGVRLFEISPDDFPENIKEKLLSLAKPPVLKLTEEDKHIKEAVISFVESFPINKNIEDDIQKLRVPLRAYLKLHLIKGEKSEYNLHALSVMTILCQLCQKMYKRYVDEDAFMINYAHVAFACFTFGSGLFNDVFPSYKDNISNIEKYAKRELAEKALQKYYEVKQMLFMEFGRLPLQVETYLNYLVRHLVWLFCEDWYLLDSNSLKPKCLREDWDQSDEDKYVYKAYKKAKLLREINFILPEGFSYTQIESFIHCHVL